MIKVEMSQLGLLKIYVHQGVTGARDGLLECKDPIQRAWVPMPAPDGGETST